MKTLEMLLNEAMNDVTIYNGPQITDGVGGRGKLRFDAYKKNLLSVLDSTKTKVVLIFNFDLMGTWNETLQAINGTRWKAEDHCDKNGKYNSSGMWIKFTRK